MNKRILIAGLFHETHSFVEKGTPMDEFHIKLGDETVQVVLENYVVGIL